MALSAHQSASKSLQTPLAVNPESIPEAAALPTGDRLTPCPNCLLLRTALLGVLSDIGATLSNVRDEYGDLLEEEGGEP